MILRNSVLLVFCLLSGAAYADKPAFGDTFTFRAGGMQSNADLTLAKTNDTFPESELNETSLGLDDDNNSLWLRADWQFADRWRLAATYSKFEANGFNMIGTDGNFGDVDWTAGASLTKKFESKLYIVDLVWDIWQSDRAHVGIGGGFHVADVRAQVGATIETNVGGQVNIVNFGTDDATLTAPLPNLILTSGPMLGEKVYLEATAGYFSLNYEDYDGELTSIRGSIEWRPFERFGVGAGYQYVDINVKRDDSTSQKEFDVKLTGPFLFLSFGI
ncbi:MAG: hypothetical protein O3A63_02025 [Proteobacteria bacterium]|nr:hypothetical protein [Pseudomonadota bacterium]